MNSEAAEAGRRMRMLNFLFFLSLGPMPSTGVVLLKADLYSIVFCFASDVCVFELYCWRPRSTRSHVPSLVVGFRLLFVALHDKLSWLNYCHCVNVDVGDVIL